MKKADIPSSSGDVTILHSFPFIVNLFLYISYNNSKKAGENRVHLPRCPPRVVHPETGPYATFGILALRLEAGQWQKVCLIADVSTSRSFAADLADRCTAGQLDPRQLNDVIEDALAF